MAQAEALGSLITAQIGGCLHLRSNTACPLCTTFTAQAHGALQPVALEDVLPPTAVSHANITCMSVRRPAA